MYNLDWRGELAMTRCGIPPLMMSVTAPPHQLAANMHPLMNTLRPSCAGQQTMASYALSDLMSRTGTGI
jgi:hypothetical protein